MRSLRYEEEVGGGNLIEKRSMDLEHAKEAWDEWEIHCLMLVSLSLQVFLFFTADLRRRSTSRVLSTVLWLTYLSADTVAIFVLGHLAVHARGPSHELMLFWAPFMLVHLGGQDNITAFSKQDNELWTRHLLSLVTQTAVAGYVVSQSSWPDTRLRAPMVLMFLCGFFKYAGRTMCLWIASPKSLRVVALGTLFNRLRHAQDDANRMSDFEYEAWRIAKARYEAMFQADKCREFIRENRFGWLDDDIMLVDASVDDWVSTIAKDDWVSAIVEDGPVDHTNWPDWCIAYQYVAACLVRSYQILYTKAPLWRSLEVVKLCCDGLYRPLVLIYTLFQCISTAIALVLFVSAEKEGHHSKADITVSYILLVGAIVLDLLPTFTSIVSYARKPFRPGSVAECIGLCLGSCIQHRGCLTRKQWSEQLAQYSITRRYYRSMPSILKPILKPGLRFFDLKHTPVTEDLKLVVLDRLLYLQTRRAEWDFASFRGERALGKWMGSQQVGRSSYALRKSLSSTVDFPSSVLIWHIATDICYFSEDNGRDTEPDETKKKKKKLSREISHYIMYLLFKCGVMLTTNSRLLHAKAHHELTEYFQQVHQPDEKETFIVLIEAMKEKEQWSMEETLYAPALPRAFAVAQELIDINDEVDGWELILEVWLEMLFYTAPRCGASFHYEHLSKGGEFITHLLFLMRCLGPFMPKSL